MKDDQLTMDFNVPDISEACPCCGAKIKIWKKPLIGIAIAELIKLYRLWMINLVPVHISKFSKQRSNFYTLKYWDLIHGSERVEGKRTAGLWIPTGRGILFVRNKLSIPSYAITRDNKLIRLTGENKTIIQALGKKFNYDELLEGSKWIRRE